MKMKWCVIGAAGIADRRTIPALVADEANELCAVMDKVEEAAKAVVEEAKRKQQQKQGKDETCQVI